MENRYKVIISRKNLYKEVELPIEATQVKVGTSSDCEFRLRKELFFEAVELCFVKNKDTWSVNCSDNLYFTAGDVRKLMTRTLSHGDEFIVKYQESDSDAFTFSFMIDFDNEKARHERAISVPNNQQGITIGSGRGCKIALESVFAREESAELTVNRDGISLEIIKTKYGVYHNGKKVKNAAIIKNTDFFSIADYSFYYRDNTLWTEIRNDMSVNGLTYSDKAPKNGYPKFNRNSRIKITINDEKIEILDPPAKPEKPKNNLFMRLLPSLGMIAASGIMAFMGGAMIIFSAVSGIMAIVTAFLGVAQNKKEFIQKTNERIIKYNRYIEGKRLEIEEARNKEYAVLEDIYISPEKEKGLFSAFSSDLFDRTLADDDFLQVRLGRGQVKAKREINFKKQERLEVEDALQEYPERLYNDYRLIANAPVVCDLKECNAIGIYGNEENRFSMLKNIVLDILARQFYSDVKLLFIASPENKKRVDWLRFLPHVANEAIGARNIVCDDEGKTLIFEYLYKEITIRQQKKGFESRMVVFFYDDCGFKNHPISKFVDKAKELGITFIFFAEKKAEIPLGCSCITELRTSSQAVLFDAEDRDASIPYVYTSLGDKEIKDIVTMLTPIYTEEISLEGSLTKNISLFELLNIIAVDDLDLLKRWNSSLVFNSMAAPIGVSKTGVINLDLHDKMHGPHGLVAGTTGSGKSEILQTYILSMATLFHPYEVAFVIIDFKGGGMVNQFKDLPHLLGAITNIDGNQINRSLKSIKAELQKRQRFFAEADVNHIDKYIKKFRAGEVKEPLPHLIIIVDEFAELKAEQPEFMKELISAARIGRSLGVHLILATQKPSGQVNEQIWSNSRFKLCLKVQSQEDSNEVIKSPLAAEIQEPGRCYLQVGNNEIFELFQSAYSGAPEKMDDGKVKEFAIYNITQSEKRVPVFVQKKQSGSQASATQLDALVKYINNYCKDSGVKRLCDICLPALSERIDFVAGKSQKDGNIVADIGIYDDPDNQYQGVYSVDVGNQNLMLIGSSRSGKTNVLQSIIKSIATKYSPDEVSVYIIDFASMVLKNFEKLNHVGGVVCPSDDEKLKNLFKLLYNEIEERRKLLMSVGVSSFAAYKEAGKKDLRQLVLIIDNITALKELYFQDDDELINLCREGLTVGISVIVANAQTAGIGYKYMSNFAARIAMFCNDSNEYSSLFDHCTERLDSIPGRCLVEIDKKHFYCQSYLAFNGEKEIDRVNEIKDFIAKANDKNKGKNAGIIPLIPTSLTEGYIAEQFASYMQSNYLIVAGLDYGTVTPYTINLSAIGTLAIVGREKSGKHNWIKYTVNMLETMYPKKSRVYVVDGIKKKLSSLKDKSNVCAYGIAVDNAISHIIEIEGILAERYQALAEGDDKAITDSPLLMLILDNIDAVSAICTNKEAFAAYTNIIGRYKSLNACIIISGIDNAAISYSSPEMLKGIRESRNVMFFDDVTNCKLFDLPLSVIRSYKKPIELGDCYCIKENSCIKLKTAVTLVDK